MEFNILWLIGLNFPAEMSLYPEQNDPTEPMLKVTRPKMTFCLLTPPSCYKVTDIVMK